MDSLCEHCRENGNQKDIYVYHMKVAVEISRAKKNRTQISYSGHIGIKEAESKTSAYLASFCKSLREQWLSELAERQNLLRVTKEREMWNDFVQKGHETERSQMYGVV